MSDRTTYKRGQVEWALWQAMCLHNHADPRRASVPSVFRNRIKRLLDLDANRDDPDTSDAFVEARPGQSGQDIEYTGFDAFVIAVALVLLDSGYNQRDVVFLMGYLRPYLDEQHRRIMADPPFLRMQMLSRGRPNAPTKPDKPTVADTAVYMVLRKVEMRELWSLANQMPDPMILHPAFCWGQKALLAEIERLSFEYPWTLVVELSELAVNLDAELKKAPAVTRGRSASKKRTAA